MWYHKFEQMLEGAHKMEKLSRMQQRVYDYIAESIAEHGYAPSVREVGEASDVLHAVCGGMARSVRVGAYIYGVCAVEYGLSGGLAVACRSQEFERSRSRRVTTVFRGFLHSS